MAGEAHFTWTEKVCVAGEDTALGRGDQPEAKKGSMHFPLLRRNRLQHLIQGYGHRCAAYLVAVHAGIVSKKPSSVCGNKGVCNEMREELFQGLRRGRGLRL